MFDSLPYVVKKFVWHASRLFKTFTPYFHIQATHAGQMIKLTLGCLNNEVVERKHHEAKSLHIAQGAGRRGPSTEIRGVSICVVHV